jgi:EmrB/QacA subfamily drug resistance transporter
MIWYHRNLSIFRRTKEPSVTTAAAPAAPPKLDPHVWRLAAVVVIGSIMSILDTTIVNVALDTLSHEMHSPLSEIQWVVTGYMLSLAAVIPVSGWAARRFGPKNVYLFSLIVFTLGSALCGIATSPTELIIFRVLQGVGGGMIMPVGQMMLAGAAGPQNMGRVMSVTSIPTLLAPILGPTIGGLIVQDLSWHWIFFVNVPVGIVGVILGMRLIPGGKGSRDVDPLDVVGLGLVAVGLPLLTYGIAEIGTLNTFDSVRVIVPIILGVVLLVAFALHALRTRYPLLQLRLHKRPTFSSASLSMFALGAGIFGSMVLLPLYWQVVRGESIIDTGLLSSPQGLGMVLVMPFTGRLVDKYGGGKFAVFGTILTAVATIPMAFVTPTTSIPFLFATMMVRGAGMGLAFMPTMTAAYAALDSSELPDATPQLNVFMRVGSSIGTAVLTVVLYNATKGTTNLGTIASGYGTAFWWSFGLIAVSIVPAIVLLVAETRARRTKVGIEQEELALDSGAVAEAIS